MSYRFNQRDKAQIGLIRNAAQLLYARIVELQVEWDESTERWQESERGQSVQSWLVEMEGQIREIEDKTDELEDSEPGA